MLAAALLALALSVPTARAAPVTGLWVEKAWLRGGKTAEETYLFAAEVRDRRIDYLFARLGPAGADGTLPHFDRRAARRWIESMKELSPGLKVLVWTGGVNRAELARGTLRLDDPAARAKLVSAAAAAVRDAGFDGVHLNIEPVQSGDPYLPLLLAELRAELPPWKLVSYAAQKLRPWWMPGLRALRSRYWTLDYLQEIAPLVDQLAVMMYDTALPSRGSYQRAIVRNTDAFLSLQDPVSGLPEVLIGVPTYAEPSWYHRPRVENIAVSLGTLARLRKRIPAGRRWGVCLYGRWTTDDAQWGTYRRLWLSRS